MGGVLVMLALGPLISCPASAQFGPRVTGVIVSIRGDILQIRPRYNTKLTRALLDNRSQIRKPIMRDISVIKLGDRVMAVGDYQSVTLETARMLMLVSDSDGWFGHKTPGVSGVGYGKTAMACGEVKSLSPLVLVGLEGKEMTITVPPHVPVLQQEPSRKEALRVGQTVQIRGTKSSDELVHIETLEIQEAPGGSGTLFGVVTAVHGPMLEVRPRFSEDTVQISVTDSTRIQRQTTLDVRSVKVGDTLTAQGILTTDNAGRLIAALLFPGAQSYPYTRPEGMSALFRGGADVTALRTGEVTALFPLTLKLKDGSTARIVVPGQVPLVDLHPAARADIHIGDKIMVTGPEKEGALQAETLLLGASPIVGFGT
jgi:hypothetical protein